MIKTLYVRSSDADRCTESFQASIPITVTGIDAADGYVSPVSSHRWSTRRCRPSTKAGNGGAQSELEKDRRERRQGKTVRDAASRGQKPRDGRKPVRGETAQARQPLRESLRGLSVAATSRSGKEENEWCLGSCGPLSVDLTASCRGSLRALSRTSAGSCEER
jgi:hypothetical protein